MEETKVIGRIEEKNLLLHYENTDKSEFVAVYGRRRVGKTFLVREVLKSYIDFEFTGMYEMPAKVQREEFQNEINKRNNENGKAPANWFEAFDNLKNYLLSLNKDIVTVFLDELPWMDTQKSNFLAALSRFWNTWGNEKPLLKLFVCGSATTWMLDKLIGDKGGLYGRISRSIYLAPFCLRETRDYLNEVKNMNYGNRQVLDTYMIFGGIPYYLDMLDSELPLSVNVDKLLFAENAPLKTEFEFLFRSLFKDSANYRKVVELLSKKLKGLTRDEISENLKLSGGEFSKILKNLQACDFLRSYSAPNSKERNRLYQLTDFFSLFYLRFVQNNAGQDEHYWTNSSENGKKNAWAGYAFEQVCLHHLKEIKTRLGISGILSNAYAWSTKPYIDSNGTSWKGGQIDLIIDRSDNVMNLCEMKYSSNEFIIDKNYAETVTNRIENFRHKEKCRKDLRCTFVTLYGVKRNKYSNIADNQIRLDDLFAEVIEP
jgi:AAA+ ATPase superfamily predicted ATPase